MSAIVANTGSGNWNVNATWVGGVQPTAADDVTIPATAVVTIPTATTVQARSVTVSLSGTLAFASTTAIINIGDATAGAGNVAFSNAGTITLTGIGTMNFISTSTTVQTITTGGQTMPIWTINGTGSKYQAADNLLSSGAGTLTTGTLDTNGKTFQMPNFVCSSVVARTLTMGASTINITGGSATVWNAVVTNLTVTANTATITCSGNNATFAGSTVNWNGLTLNMTGSGQAIASGQFTVANFTRTGTAVKTDSLLTSGAGITVTTLLTLAGNSVTNRLILQTSTPGSTTNVTAAAVSITNVDFMDVAAAGAAIPWTGSSLGNCLGNSNITFDTPVTQTRTGAGGSWSTAGNWTSRVPLPQDNVVVSSGASGTVTIDMPRIGANIDYTGFTGTATISTSNTLFGSLTYATGMTLAGTSTTTLGGRSTYTLTTAGKTLLQGVTMNAPGGTYNLQDAYNSSGRLTISNGTFNSNNFNLTITAGAAGFVASGTSTFVNFGTSTWTMVGGGAGPVSFTATAANLSLASSSFIMQGTSVSDRRPIFSGGTSIGTVEFNISGSTGSLTLSNGPLTVGTLNFSDASNARTLIITATTTLTILNAFNVNGTAGKLMSINSTVGASAGTLSKASGIVSCDYLSIQDSTATGGASWYAGANSTSVSNVTGWIFSAPPGGGGGLLLMGVG